MMIIKKYSFLILLLIISCSKKNNFNEVSVKLPNYNHSKYHVNFKTDFSTSVKISYWKDQNEVLYSSTYLGDSLNIELPYLKPSSNYTFKIDEISNSKIINSSTLYSSKTRDLPNFFPKFNLMKDSLFSFNGYLLFRTQEDPGIQFMMDDSGEIVWYSIADSVLSRPFNKGLNDTYISLSKKNIIHEISYKGDTLFSKYSDKHTFHHDILKFYDNEKSYYVGLTYEYYKYYKNDIDSIMGDGIVVYDERGKKVWTWNIFDHYIPDDEQYLIRDDWSHANGIDIDSDGNYLISFRNFDQIWKINSVNGDVIWRLGKNGDFNLENKDIFYQQHAIHKIDNNFYMLFDNGSSEYRKTSRALIFSLDESNKVFNYSKSVFLPDSLFTFKQGSVYSIDNNNYLFSSSVNNKTIISDDSGKILWTLSSDHSFYRVYYIDKQKLF